jgi:hypothetical protein
MTEEPRDLDESWQGVRSRLVTLWGAARVVAGVLLIVVGILGTLLPVIPGVPLLIAGVALIGPKHPLIRPFVERFERWREARAAKS